MGGGGGGGNDIVYFTSAGFIWLFCQYLCVCVSVVSKEYKIMTIGIKKN